MAVIMGLLAVITCVFLNSILIQCSQNGTEKILLDITCGEKKMDVKWTILGTDVNLEFVDSRQMYASLLESSCNSTNDSIVDGEQRSYMMVENDYNNQSMIGVFNLTLNMTFNYDECLTTINNETADKIVVKNKAILKVTDILREGRTKRDYYYEYNMQCELDRNTNATAVNSYTVDYDVVNVTKTFNNASDFVMALSIGFYTDDVFNVPQPSGAITVNTNEFIYVLMKEDNLNEHFKFVANQCYATKSSNPDDSENDIFFENGCRLDSTFDIMDVGEHKFGFKIQTFSYLEEQLAVFFHCKVYICKTDSTLDKCTQQCQSTKNRQRRGITEDDEEQLKEVTLTSNQIVYNTELTCADISCPLNSKCYPLKPAQCICDDGYVFSMVEKVCVSNRHVKIEEVHLDQTWNPIYADFASLEFLKLATKYESLLYKSFITTEATKDIEGVKIVAAREGSIILDTIIIHAATTTPLDAYKAFIKSINTNALEATTVQRALRVKVDITPSFVEIKEAITDMQKIIIVISIVVVLLVIFIGAILIFKIRKNRRGGTKEVTGFDNKGVAIGMS